MSCERYRAELTEVAAGQPPLAATSAHLEACPSCRAELQALRRALAYVDETLGEIAGAEPSPALRVRIRQAAAEVAEPRAWRWAWGAAAAVLAAALGVGGAWRAGWIETRRPPALAENASPGPSPARPVPVESLPTTSRATTLSLGPAAGQASIQLEARRVASAARSDVVAPEVLVPPGQQEALLRFVALVHAEKMAPPAFALAGEPSADLAEPAPLEVKPLEIVPLDPAETQGT
jgi:hypothetical protein